MKLSGENKDAINEELGIIGTLGIDAYLQTLCLHVF